MEKIRQGKWKEAAVLFLAVCSTIALFTMFEEHVLRRNAVCIPVQDALSDCVLSMFDEVGWRGSAERLVSWYGVRDVCSLLSPGQKEIT